MTELFERSWFNTVKFRMDEMSPGYIAAHVWTRGHNCTLITVRSEMMPDPELWLHLKKIAEKRWLNDKVNQDTCPTCGSILRLCRRVYLGKAFCSVCGTHYSEYQCQS